MNFAHWGLFSLCFLTVAHCIFGKSMIFENSEFDLKVSRNVGTFYCFNSACAGVKGVIGQGTFGKVRWVAPDSCANDELLQFAIKSVPKHFVVENDEQQSICRERDVLFQCDHPFICQLVATYQVWNTNRQIHNKCKLLFYCVFIKCFSGIIRMNGQYIFCWS